MKKEIVISCVIIIGIIIFDIITQNYTVKAMDGVSEVLETVRHDVQAENDNSAKEGIERTKEKWNNVKEKLVIYIEHAELEKVEMYIMQADSHIETKEYSMAIESIDMCDFVMEHIKEKYELSVKNIF